MNAPNQNMTTNKATYSPILITIIIFYFITTFTGCKGKAEQRVVQNPIPHFSVQSAAGAKYDEQFFAQKDGVISFVTSWCGPCKIELAEIATIARENPNLTVLALTYEEPTTISKQLDSLGAHVEICRIDSQTFVTFGIQRIPTRLLLHNGRIIATSEGAPTPPAKAFYDSLKSISTVPAPATQQ